MEEAFLALVRLGIGNAATEKLPDSINWNAIEALAKQHGLLGVLVDGVKQLPQSIYPPQTTWLRWIGEVIQGYEQRYVAYKKAVADLGAWYHAHGYRMLLLKGLACGLDWPRPEHRPYGDIDIYLFGQYKEADAVLTRELGIKVDNSHHHHTVFQWQGFTVENHYDFVNVHVHRSSRELDAIFKNLAFQDSGFKFQDTSNIIHLPSYISLPSANLHALFLIRHMVCHFCGASISLRQVLDWGFFLKTHHGEVDWKWLVDVLEKYHMKEFFDCVNAICVEELGFDASSFPYIQFNPFVKERILKDTLAPEFETKTPKNVWKRVPFKYRRWKANKWKRELCYEDGQWKTFWGGVWNHLLKPAGI